MCLNNSAFIELTEVLSCLLVCAVFADTVESFIQLPG